MRISYIDSVSNFQLSEYIRRGATQATIEIELYNPAGTNYVIRRVITATNKGTSSDWFLNRKKSKLDEVTYKTLIFVIQSSNEFNLGGGFNEFSLF